MGSAWRRAGFNPPALGLQDTEAELIETRLFLVPFGPVAAAGDDAPRHGAQLQSRKINRDGHGRRNTHQRRLARSGLHA
jgi:hypothetical protein